MLPIASSRRKNRNGKVDNGGYNLGLYDLIEYPFNKILYFILRFTTKLYILYYFIGL